MLILCSRMVCLVRYPWYSHVVYILPIGWLYATVCSPFLPEPEHFVDLDAVKPIGSNFFREICPSDAIDRDDCAEAAELRRRLERLEAAALRRTVTGEAHAHQIKKIRHTKSQIFPQLRLISLFFCRFEGILRGGNFLIFCFVGGWDVFFHWSKPAVGCYIVKTFVPLVTNAIHPGFGRIEAPRK